MKLRSGPQDKFWGKTLGREHMNKCSRYGILHSLCSLPHTLKAYSNILPVFIKKMTFTRYTHAEQWNWTLMLYHSKINSSGLKKKNLKLINTPDTKQLPEEKHGKEASWH